jgi:hypothetical protein
MEALIPTVAPIHDAVGAVAAPLTDALAPAGPLRDLNAPTVGPLADAVGTAAAPLANAVAAAANPLANVVATAAAPLAHVLGSGPAAPAEAIAPVTTTALVPVSPPLADAVAPAAPVADAIAPAADAIAPAAAPLSDAVAPWTANVAPLSPSLPADTVAAVGPVSAAGTPLPTELHGPGTTESMVTAAAGAPSHPVLHTVQPHSDFSALPIDNAFPFDPSLLAHGIASWESRFVIGAILGGLLAGRAAGIGMIDFTQPMLQACNVSVRAAFSQVRLLPCEQATRAVRSAVERLHGGEGVSGRAGGGNRDNGSPTKSSPTKSSSIAHRDEGEGVLHEVGGSAYVATRPFSALKPFFWSVPAAGGMLLRLFACMLASLSAMIAGRAGFRRHSRDRQELPYRRRLNP